jgi:hypothetical protein
MSKLALLALALVIVVAVPLAAEEKEEKMPDLAVLAWLVGDWEGTAGEAEFDEHWVPAKGGIMLGVGRWVKGGRATSFEFMRIEARPDGIRFVAHPGGGPGVTFRATKVAADEVVFECPENDFPKIVRYALTGEDTLEARISNSEDGEGPSQTFRLRKKGV